MTTNNLVNYLVNHLVNDAVNHLNDIVVSGGGTTATVDLLLGIDNLRNALDSLASGGGTPQDLATDTKAFIQDVANYVRAGGSTGVEFFHDVNDVRLDIIGINLLEQINLLDHGGLSPVIVSDIRLKEDVVPLQRLKNGLTLHRFRYKGSNEVYVGVMGHEVAEVMPDATVRGADGYLRVDYGRLGMSLMTWDEWVVRRSEEIRRGR